MFVCLSVCLSVCMYVCMYVCIFHDSAEHRASTRLSEAVHYAPHGHLDVQSISCDFLACSPYKFFGPHAGAHLLSLVCLVLGKVLTPVCCHSVILKFRSGLGVAQVSSTGDAQLWNRFQLIA